MIWKQVRAHFDNLTFHNLWIKLTAMTAPAPRAQPSLFDIPGPPAPATGSVPSTPLAPSPPLTPASSLAAATTAFGQHLARSGKTENTRRAFASDLRLLAQHLGGGRAIGSIATDDLNQFLTWMLEFRDEPCRPKTYARRVTTLKVLFAWLAEAGVLERDPALAVVHRAADPPLPQVLDDREAARLLSAAHVRWTGAAADPRPVLMVRLLLDTGLKKGELVRLRVPDVDAGLTPPSLLVRYDQPRWAKKERRVPFGPAVGPILAAYVARYNATERLFDCTDRNLEYILADLVTAAGLPETTSFETLRWTSALRAYRSGLDPERLRERLGLSPVTWAETERKLALLAPGMGVGPVGEFFAEGGGG